MSRSKTVYSCEWGWVGVALPHRPHTHPFSTYSTFTYESLPPVTILEKYKDITDLEKLQKMLKTLHHSSQLAHSPTACYFDFGTDVEQGAFYRDQQDCVVWCFDKETGKVKTSSGLTVAASLPEFLTRIRLENMLWYNSNIRDPSRKKFGHDKDPDADAKVKYIEHYRLLALKAK